MKQPLHVHAINLLLFIAFSIIFAPPLAAKERRALLEFRNAFVQLSKDVEKCAVSVTAKFTPDQQNKAGAYIQVANSAAGVVFDDHHVVVKRKIVSGASDIEVTFYDGLKRKARVIGSDLDYGLSLLRVENPIDSVSLPEMTCLNAEIEAGEPVIVLSNSLDVMPAVTFGVINCVRNDGMIQLSTDMPAGAGGGAVFDFYGRLVGVIAVEIDMFPDELPYSSDINSSKTVLIYPTGEVIKVAQSLLAKAEQNRAYLGILAADWPSQLGGAHVKHVFANSPASRSGFRLGDIVLSIDNHKVASAYDLFQEIKVHYPGDKVKFEILRGEQITDIVVKIDSPPASSTDQAAPVLTSAKHKPPSNQNINKEFLLMRLDKVEKELKMLRAMLHNE